MCMYYRKGAVLVTSVPNRKDRNILVVEGTVHTRMKISTKMISLVTFDVHCLKKSLEKEMNRLTVQPFSGGKSRNEL